MCCKKMAIASSDLADLPLDVHHTICAMLESVQLSASLFVASPFVLRCSTPGLARSNTYWKDLYAQRPPQPGDFTTLTLALESTLVPEGKDGRPDGLPGTAFDAPGAVASHSQGVGWDGLAHPVHELRLAYARHAPLSAAGVLESLYAGNRDRAQALLASVHTLRLLLGSGELDYRAELDLALVRLHFCTSLAHIKVAAHPRESSPVSPYASAMCDAAAALLSTTSVATRDATAGRLRCSVRMRAVELEMARHVDILRAVPADQASACARDPRPPYTIDGVHAVECVQCRGLHYPMPFLPHATRHLWSCTQCGRPAHLRCLVDLTFGVKLCSLCYGLPPTHSVAAKQSEEG